MSKKNKAVTTDETVQTNIEENGNVQTEITPEETVFNDNIIEEGGEQLERVAEFGNKKPGENTTGLKRKRGRPKGSKNGTKLPDENNAAQSEYDPNIDLEQQLNAFTATFKKVENETHENVVIANTENAQPENIQPENVNFPIRGKMLIVILDFLAPGIIRKIARSQGEDIPTKDIKLSREQKADLKDIADEAAKQFTFGLNPIFAFLLMSFLCYMENYNEAVNKKPTQKTGKRGRPRKQQNLTEYINDQTQ